MKTCPRKTINALCLRRVGLLRTEVPLTVCPPPTSPAIFNPLSGLPARVIDPRRVLPDIGSGLNTLSV